MNELLSEALSIMLIGMVTVFGFLTVLIGAMALLRWFTAGSDQVPASTAATPTAQPDAPLMAAVAAAVHKYHRRDRR
ncbi:OadG family protein [Pseudidiomarina sp.]|uniref:OadG family protein n=1 Tax=Pseudidiomarina sp. TaxID=2081707 RepID=UPI00299E5841|nr:OadG family protein [Pseudidiomarina sp.]MDX1706103.1 OadG family protein [Pseudidiomarina sp.]